MDFKIAIILNSPVDIRKWPFDNISVSVLDKTYIVIKGHTHEFKQILHDINQVLPHKLEGMAITFETNKKETVH